MYNVSAVPMYILCVVLFGMDCPLFYFRQEIKINANLSFSYKSIWQVFKGEGERKHLLYRNLLPLLTLIASLASLLHKILLETGRCMFTFQIDDSIYVVQSGKLCVSVVEKVSIEDTKLIIVKAVIRRLQLQLQ